jgi:hypothetical protein
MLSEIKSKQATRIGEYTALVLMLSFCSDCFALGIWSLVYMKILQIGDNFIAQAFIASLYSVFYFGTLSQYYTGSLDLGVFNCVSDGSVGIVAVTLITGILGQSFWTIGLFDASFLSINGVNYLTAGQLAALILVIWNIGVGF